MSQCEMPYFVCWTTADYIPPTCYMHLGVRVAVLSDEEDELRNFNGLICIVDHLTDQAELLEQIQQALEYGMPVAVMADDDIPVPATVYDQPIPRFSAFSSAAEHLKVEHGRQLAYA